MKLSKALLCILISSLLLVLLAGCLAEDVSGDDDNLTDEETPAPTEETPEINLEDMSYVNVMSYNIFYQDIAPRAENIIDYINEYPPDVMGLQEVVPEWSTYLDEAFVETGEYEFYGYGRYGTDWGDENQPTNEAYSLIYYRQDKFEAIDKGHFWLSTTPHVYSAQFNDLVSDFPRCINWVTLRDRETGGEFVFLNAHLDPQNETIRLNSAMLIVDQMKQIAGERPVIMVGDWNAQLTSSTVSYFTSNGFENVRFTAEESSNLGTWHEWEKREPNSWLFGDIIFASEGKTHITKFDVLTDKYDGKYPSDHHPLVADIYY